MRLHVPETVAEASGLLASDGARPLAGGQSLVAMMNAGLVAPSALVSLRRVAGLGEIDEAADGRIRFGAMVPHERVAKLEGRDANARLMARTAARIGHPAIRSQGTIGGSIAHADPAADYPTAITCAEATVAVSGAGGTRTVAAAEFFRGFFETAAGEGEMVTSIEVPEAPAGAGSHYEKFSIVDGDFAVASVAAVVARDGEGRCTFARVAVGGCGPTPVRLREAEAILEGSRLEDEALAAAGAMLARACDPVDDFRGSAGYRLKLVPRLVKRAVLAAAEDAAAHG